MSASLELSERLHTSQEADEIETLRAALHERQEQLREVMATGEKLLEERDELQRQVEVVAEREAHAIAAHRREVTNLQQQIQDRLNDNEAYAQRAAELQAELRDTNEQLAKSREELRRIATTNDALRADMRHHENQQDAIRRKSVMNETTEDQNGSLRLRVTQLEGELTIAKASANSLLAQREAERSDLQSQVTEWREKAANLQQQLERARREADASKEKLKDADRQAAHEEGHLNGGRRSFTKGSNAPSVPTLRLDDANRELDREYENFSARSRARTSVVFTLGGANDDAELGASQRRRRDSDDEETPRPAATASSSPAHRTLEDTEMQELAPKGRRSTRNSVARSAQPARVGHDPTGTCPTCGRGDDEGPQPKKDKGCPCVVM
jgi:myosin heavy subunit